MTILVRKIIFLLLVLCTIQGYAQHRILIFSKTTGFRHASIEHGTEVIKALASSANIASDHTEDSRLFTDSTLSKYDAVVFLSTTGDILNENEKTSFVRFIQSGNGFVGIHAASDTEYNWPWYGQLVGGYFASHPAVQDAKIQVKNRKHLSTKHLPQVWFHRDEWYNYKSVKKGLHVLMNLDETSYKDGKMGKFHPIAWYQDFDGGRSFYTGLGHTSESFDEENFQKHILGGILYAIKKK
ncbi:ThuA domain-containing protein [Sphingobacterium sp. SRCM116780]|uniref:ThuA domain-containing protein n=1 Tax=Sphingobacterium sp. SRCM116780 TaxID=2907623 RepID=UPI001F2AB472|nr:ThuA domain-containing protein [Sphingobacterium sp. SRCM116780]UIR57737.1 ThuA domain-containing protein [Sphingobacterium sp. SRCM116780]